MEYYSDGIICIRDIKQTDAREILTRSLSRAVALTARIKGNVAGYII